MVQIFELLIFLSVVSATRLEYLICTSNGKKFSLLLYIYFKFTIKVMPKKSKKIKASLLTSTYVLILPESSSVKTRLKEEQHFNLVLHWTGTVSEFLGFLAVIDTMYSVDSMKTLLS